MYYFADRHRLVADFVQCENGDRNNKKLGQDQEKPVLKDKGVEPHRVQPVTIGRAPIEWQIYSPLEVGLQGMNILISTNRRSTRYAVKPAYSAWSRRNISPIPRLAAPNYYSILYPMSLVSGSSAQQASQEKRMEHHLCDGVTGVTITLPPNLARFEESKMSKYEDPYPSLPNPLARNERTFGKAQKAVPPGFRLKDGPGLMKPLFSWWFHGKIFKIMGDAGDGSFIGVPSWIMITPKSLTYKAHPKLWSNQRQRFSNFSLVEWPGQVSRKTVDSPRGEVTKVPTG